MPRPRDCRLCFNARVCKGERVRCRAGKFFTKPRHREYTVPLEEFNDRPQFLAEMCLDYNPYDHRIEPNAGGLSEEGVA